MGNVERDDITELLSAYLDGEVDQRDRAYVERMLESDPNASALLEDLRATSVALGSLPRHRAPASIEEDVLNRLERSDLLSGLTESPQVVSGRRSGFRAFTVMAAMVGLVVISAMLYYADWNNLKPPAIDRVASIVAEPNRVDSILDKANVEDKLIKGVKIATLKSHPFDNETVRLRVVVGDRAERDSVSARLVSRLTKRHIADLAKLDGDSSNANEAATFFLKGQSSVNFDAGDQSQILVRVPTSTLDELLDVLAGDTKSADRVTLAAGGLTFRGEGAARKTLRQLARVSSFAENFELEADVADEFHAERFADASMKKTRRNRRARAKNKVEEKGMFDGILDAFGMPADLFEQDLSEESIALGDLSTGNGKADRQGRLAFDKREKARPALANATDRKGARLQTGVAGSDEKVTSLKSKDFPSQPKATPLSKGLSKESSGLVSRRSRALKSKQVKVAATEAVGSEPKRADDGVIKSIAAKTRTGVVGKSSRAIEDPLVTLVIQLMPTASKKKPSPLKPTARTKAPAQAKLKGKPAGSNKSDQAKK